MDNEARSPFDQNSDNSHHFSFHPPHEHHVSSVSDTPTASVNYSASQTVSFEAENMTRNDLKPQPVVKVLSPMGVEYIFMTVALLTAAAGLDIALISLINGKHDFDVLASPAALLIVAVPVFGFFLLRFKKMELKDSGLRFDASKRRSTQFIQILNFFICFFAAIGYVGAVFSKLGGDYHGSLFKLFIDLLVVVAVSGGLLFYYWRDEHTKAYK